MDKLINTMKSAAVSAFAAVNKVGRKDILLKQKSAKDYVTNCDIIAEEQIFRVLKHKYPDSAVLSEELGYIEGKDYLWIIDPIDGTHNFMYGLSYYGISIAAAQNGKTVAGLIYVPDTGEIYYASRGKGAYLNDKQINVSSRNNLIESVVAYDNQFHNEKLMLNNLPKVAQACLTVRIFGAASVDLCNIARGFLDARILHKSKLVDFAAGASIVQEAGGKVTDFSGLRYSLDTRAIIASNGHIHEQLVQILNKKER